MNTLDCLARKCACNPTLLACTVAALIAMPIYSSDANQAKVAVLKIGTSGSLVVENETSTKKSSLESLQAFIKAETRLDNEILRQKSWGELTDKLAKEQLQLGVYLGFEFAWAQGKHPDLKALALAINVDKYPVVSVVVQKNDKAKDFADLQGQTLSLPVPGLQYASLFIDHECKTTGKEMETFFSKVTKPDNVDDALDDVVDGIVQVAAVNHAALEAFKRSKPARFAKLKEVATSQPFPPVVVAYYSKTIDDATLKRIKNGVAKRGSQRERANLLDTFPAHGLHHPSRRFHQSVRRNAQELSAAPRQDEMSFVPALRSAGRTRPSVNTYKRRLYRVHAFFVKSTVTDWPACTCTVRVSERGNPPSLQLAVTEYVYVLPGVNSGVVSTRFKPVLDVL